MIDEYIYKTLVHKVLLYNFAPRSAYLFSCIVLPPMFVSRCMLAAPPITRYTLYCRPFTMRYLPIPFLTLQMPQHKT